MRRREQHRRPYPSPSNRPALDLSAIDGRYPSVGIKELNSPGNGSDCASPDGVRITHRNYIKIKMSGKLVFEEGDEHPFTADDLEDLKEIGRGQFGVVHKMRHTASNRIIAVKKVRFQNRPDDPEEGYRMKELTAEIKTIQDAASCKDIVAYYGVTTKEGDCLICMELMDISLERMYKLVADKQEKVNEDVLGVVGMTILNALNSLKSCKGIMHRDVKPSNILLSLEGDVKLCDFGISRYLENSIAKTVEKGCRPYMAPERLQHPQDAYDIRADVWSLGMTMLEVALTKYPYNDFDKKTVFMQTATIVEDDPTVLTPQDGFSHRTTNFIGQCLTKEKEQRPTFEGLMRTDFYKYYSRLPDTKSIVKNYLTKLHEEDKGKPDSFFS
uniref:mitogen-activated protein kinase kinase n=1 Tax=Panagrellus redivivus TaxID=6233 RepID=A0A7E4UYC7_PANRE